MHNVSQAYKNAMNKSLRERAYIQVGLGVVSQEAQTSANVNGNNLGYWSSTGNLFSNDKSVQEYATLERDFFKADGKYLVMPKEYNLYDVGIATENLNGSIRVNFNAAYSIKGLTLDFGEAYPTEFKVITENGEYPFSNDEIRFQTMQNFGDTSYLIIQPITMIGGQQRLRLKTIIMGVALIYGNADISDSSFTEFISPISAEVPSSSFEVTILDPENKYNVDSDDSFINFLEPGQNVSVSMGATLDNGNVEWINLCNLSLQSWASEKGKFTFSAVDKFENDDNKYSESNRIYDRSAYSEIVSIFNDMGLEPDEYEIDDYLTTVILHNPLPEGTHKECLQTIANACRCVFFQDSNGKICVRTNFALVLDPEDVNVDTHGTKAEWSNPENILSGSQYVYADFTENSFKADGSTTVATRGIDYLDTGFVSQEISDSNGRFKVNPKISLSFNNASTYYGLYMKFDNNAPKEVVIKTYLNNGLVSNKTYQITDNVFNILEEFDRFNKIEFEFTETFAHNRISVNKISFNDFNDYKLRFNDMMKEPYGEKEAPVKSISVKIYSYEIDDKGNPKEIDDDVWFYKDVNSVGENLEVANPLIHTTEMAREVCEWLANYYRSNVVYSVDYRGDARLNANDIIHMDSRVKNNLLVTILENNLSFNGAWSGSLTMRKAIRQGEE